ncbi:hypothetical protein PFISCL1PPCAC_28975, partial [Pristionchus fissidentatus]
QVTSPCLMDDGTRPANASEAVNSLDNVDPATLSPMLTAEDFKSLLTTLQATPAGRSMLKATAVKIEARRSLFGGHAGNSTSAATSPDSLSNPISSALHDRSIKAPVYDDEDDDSHSSSSNFPSAVLIKKEPERTVLSIHEDESTVQYHQYQRGGCLGYEILFRNNTIVLFLNEKLSKLTLADCTMGSRYQAQILAAAEHGELAPPELFDDCVRNVCNKLRLNCSNAISPSTQELRAFLLHIFRNYPKLSTKEFGVSTGCAFYRRLYNKKTRDISNGDLPSSRKKGKKSGEGIIDSNQMMTPSEFSTEMLQLRGASRGSSAFLSIVTKTREFRRNWKTQIPADVFRDYPIIIREFHIISSDFLHRFPSASQFVHVWTSSVSISLRAIG